MHLFTTSIVCLLAVGATGDLLRHGRRLFSLHSKRQDATQHQCLTGDEAYQVGSVWTELLSAYSAELADTALTEDFTDYSASALALNAECRQAPGFAPPIGEPVFRSREEFKARQGQAPHIESEILQVWSECRTVMMRWEMTSLGTRPVFGNIVFDTVPVRQSSALR